MTFQSQFQQAFTNPFPTEVAAAENWWLSGGISAGDCVAAYQPKGASSLSASYINLNNPGTYDSVLGVAPTWDAVNGWAGGASAYLRTGIIISNIFYSVIVRFSDSPPNLERILGTYDGANTKALYISSNFDGADGVAYYSNDSTTTFSKIETGVIGISGDSIYTNGTFESKLNGARGTSAGSLELYLLAANVNGNAIQFFTGKIQAISIYNRVLTAQENLDVKNAMNLL